MRAPRLLAFFRIESAAGIKTLLWTGGSRSALHAALAPIAHHMNDNRAEHAGGARPLTLTDPYRALRISSTVPASTTPPARRSDTSCRVSPTPALAGVPSAKRSSERLRNLDSFEEHEVDSPSHANRNDYRDTHTVRMLYSASLGMSLGHARATLICFRLITITWTPQP